jgi:hypothetical protein
MQSCEGCFRKQMPRGAGKAARGNGAHHFRRFLCYISRAARAERSQPRLTRSACATASARSRFRVLPLMTLQRLRHSPSRHRRPAAAARSAARVASARRVIAAAALCALIALAQPRLLRRGVRVRAGRRRRQRQRRRDQRQHRRGCERRGKKVAQAASGPTPRAAAGRARAWQHERHQWHSAAIRQEEAQRLERATRRLVSVRALSVAWLAASRTTAGAAGAGAPAARAASARRLRTRRPSPQPRPPRPPPPAPATAPPPAAAAPAFAARVAARPALDAACAAPRGSACQRAAARVSALAPSAAARV